jgi:hypothetical protein
MPGVLPSVSTVGCCAGSCSSVSIDQLIAEAIEQFFSGEFLAGHGSPEGVVTGLFLGQLYTDLDTMSKYTFGGTVGTKIGWG